MQSIFIRAALDAAEPASDADGLWSAFELAPDHCRQKKHARRAAWSVSSSCAHLIMHAGVTA